jgi:hypothetical protein
VNIRNFSFRRLYATRSHGANARVTRRGARRPLRTPPPAGGCRPRRASPHHALWAPRENKSAAETRCGMDAPNRAKIRAGVPRASRMRTGRSGLDFLMAGYAAWINCLGACGGHAREQARERVRPAVGMSGERWAHRVPSEACPDWQQRIRISRSAGESALANVDIERDGAAGK